MSQQAQPSWSLLNCLKWSRGRSNGFIAGLHHSPTPIIYIIQHYFILLYVCVYMLWQARPFSASTTLVLGFELRSWGLVASPFNHWAISQALVYSLKRTFNMQSRDKYPTFPQGAELIPVWHKHFVIGRISPVTWSYLSVRPWLGAALDASYGSKCSAVS